MESGKDIKFQEEEGQLLSWRVTDGAFVAAGSVLFTYMTLNGEKKSLKSPASGVVSLSANVQKEKKLTKGMKIACLCSCSHAIVIKDMCATCGKDLRGKSGVVGDLREASSASISMIHHVPELVVSDELAQKIGNRDRELLLKARKLVLLVDLDQTLIHTTNFTFKSDITKDVLHYQLKGADFYTKIRPHTDEFLRRMAELYEMHIISYGERQYAHRIAEFLDPNKIYFGHRILSRDELFCAMYKTKNMQALFPCGDHMIAMIDDRPDVWQYSDALVQVKPYRFFKEVGDINAPRNEKGEPIVSTNYAETEIGTGEDETLEYVSAILTKIHSAFYELYDDAKIHHVPDLKGIISYLRRQVLRDCSIVLSGIVPIGVDTSRTEAYRLCLQFGATVTEKLTDATTHVVAARWGTSKVNDARKRPEIAVVNPRWLFACVERWEKADEKEFPLVKITMRSHERPLSSTVTEKPLVADEFSRLPTFGKEVLSQMTGEEESDNDGKKSDEKSCGSLSQREGKRKTDGNKNDDDDVSSLKRQAMGKATEKGSEKLLRSEESGSEDDEMAAAVEREFFSL